MDLRTFSEPQIPVIFVYFLPCILDSDNPYAGNLFLFCQKKSTQNDVISRLKSIIILIINRKSSGELLIISGTSGVFFRS